MKNITKIGMGMFVVIAMMLIGGGEVQAKGALHGTLTVTGGPPGSASCLEISFVRFSPTEPLVTSTRINIFQFVGAADFDAFGEFVFRFATPLFARMNMTAVEFNIRDFGPRFTEAGSCVGNRLRFVFVPLEDLDGDGLIDVHDRQDLIAPLPPLL